MSEQARPDSLMRCTHQANGPWQVGDVVAVDVEDATHTVVVLAEDGTARSWGPIMYREVVRDLFAGAMEVLWVNPHPRSVVRQEFSKSLASAPPSEKEPLGLVV